MAEGGKEEDEHEGSFEAPKSKRKSTTTGDTHKRIFLTPILACFAFTVALIGCRGGGEKRRSEPWRPISEGSWFFEAL